MIKTILKWPRKYPLWFFKIPNTKTYMYHWYNSDLITYKILIIIPLIIIPLILYMIVSSILYYIAFSIVQREWKNCIMYAYWNVFWNFVFVVCDTLCCPRKTCPMIEDINLQLTAECLVIHFIANFHSFIDTFKVFALQCQRQRNYELTLLLQNGIVFFEIIYVLLMTMVFPSHKWNIVCCLFKNLSSGYL